MSVWVLAGVVLTGAWTQLDEIGPAALLPMAIIVALDRHRHLVPLAIQRPRFHVTVPVVAAIVIAGLHLVHALLTAREEFGFGGDEGYHLSAMRAFAIYYLNAIPFLALSLAVFVAAVWTRRSYAASATMAILIGSSFFLPEHPMFGRYPTGFYHLATPLNVAFEVAGIPYPFTAAHIMNTLSVPAWLFLLRPMIIGRWPDWQVLPVALLVYFQAPAFTYTASTLIEPWAIVFLLLAIEALVVFPNDDRWVAVLLGSVATFFKETAILLLPTLWLLACVQWNGYRPSLRRHAIAVGVAAITPFIAYYAVRLDAQVHRTAMIAIEGVWTQARLAEWVTNVQQAMGPSALVGIAVLLIATLRHVMWTLTAVAVTTYFFADALGLPWTGYSRFLALALIALSGAVIAAGHGIEDRRILVGVPALLIALQVLPVARVLALDFMPDYERNSLEWNGSLIRLPIRSLIETLPSLSGVPPRRVRVVTAATDLTSLRVAYPDLAIRYELLRDDGSTAAKCACRDEHEAVLGGFEWPANFGDTPAARSAFERFSVACLKQVEATCRDRQVERHRRGAIVGVIGVGVR